MDEQTKKIKNLIKLMRKQGLLELKLNDLHLVLSPAAFQLSKRQSSDTPATDANLDSEYSLDEIALWSTPGVPNA